MNKPLTIMNLQCLCAQNKYAVVTKIYDAGTYFECTLNPSAINCAFVLNVIETWLKEKGMSKNKETFIYSFEPCDFDKYISLKIPFVN